MPSAVRIPDDVPLYRAKLVEGGPQYRMAKSCDLTRSDVRKFRSAGWTYVPRLRGWVDL